MASGQVLEKLRNYYFKSETEVRKWDSTQSRLVSLLTTISNILGRVPALQDSRHYGELLEFQDYQKKLLSTQLAALEELMGEAQAVLRELDIIVQNLEKTYKNAARTIQQDKRLTPAARAVIAPPVPSINQCLEGLEIVWKMHLDELLLQQALTSEMQYGRSTEEMQEVLRAATAQVNIEENKVKDLFHLIAATAEISAGIWSFSLFADSACRSSLTTRRVQTTMTSAMKPKIEAEIWSDLACPWCYAGHKRITKAIEQLKTDTAADIKVTWHAFLLDPNFHKNHPTGEPIDEYITAKFGPNALAMKNRVIQSGTPDGATFSSWTWRANTFPGHRLVALAKQHGKSHQVNSLLFQASYEQGENISDLDVLIRIGKQLELPDVEEWVRSDEGSLEVLKDFSEARHLGVTGVPAFFIKSGKSQTYALSGAQPVDVFVETFDRVLKEGS
ncbi:hypothetical protein Ndes2437B_g03628 [Nannochloris sp. 'desiccata']